LQANLIMPEPCDFISKALPQSSIIRPASPGQLDRGQSRRDGQAIAAWLERI
jgi:hypothetical protein